MRKSILLVDDNPNDRMLTVRALNRSNIANRIDEVKDGQEALDYLFAEGSYADRDPRDLPQVVLLDLKLPKIDGHGVLKQMRENPLTQRVSVVMLTSSKEQMDMVKSYDLGANSYVRKPVDFNEFTEVARQLGVYWLILNETPELEA